MKQTFLFLMFLVLILGCSKVNTPLPETETTSNIQLNSSEKNLVETDNQFGFKLFGRINETVNDSNIFISPLSISMALGMTLNGADGDTYEAMKTAMQLGDLSLEEINHAYKHIIQLLSNHDPQVTFNLANSIWHREQFDVEADFLNLNREYFNAEVNAIDFTDPSAVSLINGWVNSKTSGKIETIIDYIPMEIVMYLINAIYFNATWTYEFDPEFTMNDVFYTENGGEIQTPFMTQTNNFLYFIDEQIEVIDFPYGNGDFRMTLLLPRSATSIDSVITNMESESWHGIIASLSEQRGTVSIPKLMMRYKIKLNQVLEILGMGIAFDPSRADFSKISANSALSISEVLHKTFVKINEEGTEAAAVTVVGLGYGLNDDPLDFVMNINRPFIFAIRENSSQILLFLGKIVEPEWSE